MFGGSSEQLSLFFYFSETLYRTKLRLFLNYMLLVASVIYFYLIFLDNKNFHFLMIEA